MFRSTCRKVTVTPTMMALGPFLLLGLSPSALAQTSEEIRQELETLKQRIEELERDLEQDKAQKAEEEAPQEVAQEELIEHDVEEVEEAREAEGIVVGGAVRFQYSYEDYDDDNTDRGGDLDFDTFRLNFDGSVKGIILSAEWRYYQYMQVIHHAWIGYDFTETWQGQAGITRVPFGNLPYDSHNYFFSSNYYLGLEDDYDAGLNALWDSGPWNLQLAYYLNDELGGIDGYLGDTAPNERYSYDPVGQRPPTEGTYADPSEPIAQHDMFNARLAYTFGEGTSNNTQIGVSGMYGHLLNDDDDNVGTQNAYAVHLNGNYGRWNLQLQATQYEYDLDSGFEKIAVGAYAFYDTIPAKATTYTANVAYALPVNAGPISSLTFYNDYSLVTDKSGTDPTTGEDLEETFMNVTGMALSAGAVYTYFDFVAAENQPFIGGSIGANGEGTNYRFNINVGYYF
jgi:hypothetical protein